MEQRYFDVIFSCIALGVLAVPFVLIGVLIRFNFGSPVLFRQVRAGQFGKAFEMVKFRTMTDERDGAGVLLPDSVRLTPFGNWLRSTSLDELPSLLNVLKGEMSLVGPRPLLVEYVPLYSPMQARRHEVRPGITGWAQVNGRNALTWERKFELDVWYVDNRSFWLNLKILLMTVRKVFLREGISAAGEATMPFFRGSDSSVPEQAGHDDA
jgi:lipopolysaccharide/colanic/teichoic acid biosynthesis glycosyltransferase